jgi:hypothetical protein
VNSNRSTFVGLCAITTNGFECRKKARRKNALRSECGEGDKGRCCILVDLDSFTTKPETIGIDGDTTKEQRREFPGYLNTRRELIECSGKDAVGNMGATATTGEDDPRFCSFFVESFIVVMADDSNNTGFWVIEQVPVFDFAMVHESEPLGWEGCG